ncbi:hypothetical protein FI667_g12338, partial [Globisporangium splendens]
MKPLQLFSSMPEPWQAEMGFWKGVWKPIPYSELKTRLHSMAQNVQTMSRYSRQNGSPESEATKSETILKAKITTNAEPGTTSLKATENPKHCEHCEHQFHTMIQCCILVKDMVNGTLRHGVNLPSNFRVPSQRSHPYGNQHCNRTLPSYAARATIGYL